ncbi:UDP-GlcNAc:undecaprenyl-phosphate GlcNAc-1-phosphate transferase [Candidatus Planktophila dulcis]|jgi:UDP-GlcNAc:undecaprenyl-phosphate GlcNAc-1-phosphate transferase|uniref:MraY family glycosyltransferase n=1 Tax=Candidatus Planktophila dulcis TaxID=1884914 RepID=UPI000BACC106|nr:MraY family glycosyltransferase [Candidatus Planktophila dulcis]ASY14197.1 UDP-GlcNAc:undecaprenyl-phosphate GlcNAc-1-phosphate transferase [Candidatus Planktophila dulcis]ASY20884.1 UDP-GlcNAc:undecaprenyl-phosphate GlcNAc-1-phosphate transferase [Candidatus Planktophila dulcis]
MREYLVTLLLAAALCYVVTPFVRSLAIKVGAVAQIRTRDIHTTPTPRWGGLAMWIAMALTFAMVNHLSLVGKSFGRESLGIFLAATLLVAIGLVDDRFELDALTKLAGQALAAGILLIFGIQVLWLPINGVITLPPSIGQLVTVMIVLVTINAVNFIDGLDGLAAGIVAISGAAFFAFAYLLAVIYGFSRAGAPSLITAVIIGICIGFLPHNVHPAKIFMGDSGSMFLGLLLAASAITLTGQIDPNAISAEKLGPTLLPLMLPFAVLAIPLIDLFSAIFRRLRAGQSPFSSDKEHMHHRILRAGNTHLRTTLIMYLWTATIAFPVVVSAFAQLWVAAIVAGAMLAFTLYYSKSGVGVSAKATK